MKANKNLIAVVVTNALVRISLAVAGTLMAMNGIKGYWFPFLLIPFIGGSYSSSSDDESEEKQKNTVY